MKKSLITIIILFSISGTFNASGQEQKDTIYLKNKSKQEVFVTRLQLKSINYKLEMKSRVEHIFLNNEIDKIEFADGITKFFTPQQNLLRRKIGASVSFDYSYVVDINLMFDYMFAKGWNAAIKFGLNKVIGGIR